MQKNILLILQKNRTQSSIKVQEILSHYGCFIKTRLGLHDTNQQECHPGGFIFLDMAEDKKAIKDCLNQLNQLEGVKAQWVEMGF